MNTNNTTNKIPTKIFMILRILQGSFIQFIKNDVRLGVKLRN
jgi:hypothetical protein